jgi:hypothetical protein
MPDVTSHNLVEVVEDLKDEVGAALVTVSTTAALAENTDAINTEGKYEGKPVFNTTTNILVIATGAAAGDVWANAGTGVTAHTPA